MGKHTRRSDLMFNTEYRKINKRTGEMEEDCREMSEERITEMMQSYNLRKVRSVAKSCNIATSGSKTDIILRIKECISRREGTFNKIFSKLWGHSGGWLSFSCPHGIVYYLKFILRSESCRDYLDGILSMKFIPNICVIDMAQMVAKHANTTRSRDAVTRGLANDNGLIFYPFEGRLVDPEVPEFVAEALENNLRVSFPWILRENHPAKVSVDVSDGCSNRLIHPATGSDARLCLFDRFHETNTNSEIEALRRITGVTELHGYFNSQVSEQLHLRCDSDKRFLNMMNPATHIYLFRSILNHHNNTVNEMLIKPLVKKSNGAITEDSIGRVVILAKPDVISVKSNKCDISEQLNISVDESEIAGFGKESLEFSSDEVVSPQHSEEDVKIDTDTPAVDIVQDLNEKEDRCDREVANDAIKTPPRPEKREECFFETNLDVSQTGGMGSTSSPSLAHTPGKKSITQNKLKVNNLTSDMETIANAKDSQSRPVRKAKRKASCLCCHDTDEEKTVKKKYAKTEARIVTSLLPTGNLTDPWLKPLDAIQLTMADKCAVLSGNDLSQNVINFALAKLRTTGLSHIASRITPMKVDCRERSKGRFVQVLSHTKSHYVVVTDVDVLSSEEERGARKVLYIYDSIWEVSYRKKSHEVKYSVSFIQEICDMMQYPYRNVTIKVMQVPQAERINQSGIMAMLHAYLIIHKYNPCEIEGSYPGLVQAFLHFLATGDFDDVVTLRKSIDHVYIEWREDLYCHCYRIEENHRHMKLCDNCKGWFHEECEKFEEESQIVRHRRNKCEDQWFCKNCTNKCYIDLLPPEILRKIFCELCVDDERMHCVLSLVCQKWHELIDITFIDMVHLTWMDRTFHANKRSKEKQKKDRVPFSIMKCLNCLKLFKVKEGYFRNPFNKCTGSYFAGVGASRYCYDCELICDNNFWEDGE